MSKKIKWCSVAIMIFLNVSLWFSVNAYAQVIREKKPKGAGSGSRTKSEDIQYYAKWRIRYILPGTVVVKWAGVEHKITDLDPVVKEYLWEHSGPEARQQLYDCYYYTTAIKKEWGKELGYRMDAYYGAASEWGKAKKQWRERQKLWAVPDEAIKFLSDADLFLKIHKEELTKEQIEGIKKSKEEIKSLGLLIGVIEVKKKEIAVKGISAGLIGIITDYCLGFTRPGFKATSELAGMIVGDLVAVLKEAKNKDPSAGEQIALLNEQIAKIKGVLNKHIEMHKSRWQEFLGEEQEEVEFEDVEFKEDKEARKKLYEEKKKCNEDYYKTMEEISKQARLEIEKIEQKYAPEKEACKKSTTMSRRECFRLVHARECEEINALNKECWRKTDELQQKRYADCEIEIERKLTELSKKELEDYQRRREEALKRYRKKQQD